MKESDLKGAVEDYLTYKQNQGELYFDRLNSGDFIVTYGASGRRRIKGCREGTADFMVLMGGEVDDYCGHCINRTIFLELKGEKGRTSPAQNAFKILVESQGASYFVIRSIEGLEKALQ